MPIEQKLREDLENREYELKEAEAECERLRWQIQYIRTLLQGAEEERGVTTAKPVQVPSPTLTEEVGPHQYVLFNVPQVMKEVLAKAGHPLHIQEIARRAIAGGFGPPSLTVRELVPNFTSLVGKDRKRGLNRFVRVGKGMYDLAKS